MPKQDEWMWAEALAMLERAERLNRQFCRPVASAPRIPTWEPPVDVLETAMDVIVLAALPGVDADHIGATIVDGALVISGERTPPSELRSAAIHRLELPQGRFERVIPLPAGRYQTARRHQHNGCLVVTLRKIP